MVGPSNAWQPSPPKESEAPSAVSRERVALIHGVGLDGSMWNPLREYLKPEYDVQVLELLGHGHRPPAPEGITLAELAADVAERLEPNTHLVGFCSEPSWPSTWPGTALGWSPASCRSHPCARAHRRSMPPSCSGWPPPKSDFPATVEASIRRWYPKTPPSRRNLSTPRVRYCKGTTQVLPVLLPGVCHRRR